MRTDEQVSELLYSSIHGATFSVLHPYLVNECHKTAYFDSFIY